MIIICITLRWTHRSREPERSHLKNTRQGNALLSNDMKIISDLALRWDIFPQKIKCVESTAILKNFQLLLRSFTNTYAEPNSTTDFFSLVLLEAKKTFVFLTLNEIWKFHLNASIAWLMIWLPSIIKQLGLDLTQRKHKHLLFQVCQSVFKRKQP